MDTTWQDVKTGAGTVPVPEGQRQRWFLRKKHRKMSKLQVGDALELRGSVMVALVWVAIAVMGLGYWVLARAAQAVMRMLW